MSSIKRFALPLSAACISLLAFLATGTSAYALVLDGITPSGQPVFMNPVKVRYNPKNETLKAWTNGSGREFSLWDGSTLYAARGSLTLNASVGLDEFNQPVFNGGTVQIKGGIAELGITGGGNVLMSADLVSANLTSDSSLWGFNTENIFCNAQMEAFIGQCTNAESVYLVLNSLFSGDFTSSFTGSATAHTTIPVPAAVWLFGSALGLLGWVRRRANAAA
jgi:hypothetical protein